MWKGTNGGADWDRLNVGNQFSSHDAIAIKPVYPYPVYVSGIIDRKAFLVQSIDGGAVWNPINVSDSLVMLQSIYIDQDNPDLMYTGGYKRIEGGGCKIFRSNDGGVSWEDISGNLVSPGIREIAPASLDVIYVVAQPLSRDSVWRINKTTDGGNTWKALGLGRANTIVVHPENRNILYAGTDGGVFVSNDAGQSWTEMNDGLTNLFVSRITIHPQNPSKVFAATFGGVFVADFSVKNRRDIRGPLQRKPNLTVSYQGMSTLLKYSVSAQMQAELKLFGISGREMLSFKGINRSGRLVLPQWLPSGTYLAVIYTNQYRHTRTIFVQ